MFALPAKVLCYTITLLVTAVVAWGLWQCQYPGEPIIDNRPLVYPPSRTSAHTTEHGWPAMWLVRSKTRDLPSGKTLAKSYTTLPRGLAVDLLAWTLILSCTAHTMWRATRRRAQFTLQTIFSAHVAVAVILCWWSVEYGNTYFAGNPVLTELLRDAPTTPLLRLLQCPATASIPVLFGMFCLLLHVNACLIRGVGKLNRIVQKGLVVENSQRIGNRKWTRLLVESYSDIETS